MPDKPRLKRADPKAKVGIVHLGPGAFFRAFNAIYTDEAMQADPGDWGIVAVSLKSPTARDQLAPQDGVYTSVTLSEQGNETAVISSISDVLVAPEDPAAIVRTMSEPSVRIVSLTVTEKGYCHEPATGALNVLHPDIAHDLVNIDTPKSALGFIIAAMRARKSQGHKPFTVLSCDNLPSNGPMVRQLVLEFARHLDPGLADWIAENATFPATMVDRITPATTDEIIAQLAADEGFHDPAAVAHEAFRQWVIEDDFVDGRPSWEKVGAQMVRSVENHELMKLRCLNGTHSTLAYLGYLAGFETIADCVAEPAFAALCDKLWREEITPVIAQPDGEDLGTYCANLLDRYRDRSIRHRTWQIAMDGSQKLPQRILGTIRDNLAEGMVPDGLCIAVAAWMRYVGGVDEAGNEIDVRDPLAETLRDNGESLEERIDRLLAIEEIFGNDLPMDQRFKIALSKAYQRIIAEGALAITQDYIGR